MAAVDAAAGRARGACGGQRVPQLGGAREGAAAPHAVACGSAGGESVRHRALRGSSAQACTRPMWPVLACWLVALRVLVTREPLVVLEMCC